MSDTVVDADQASEADIKGALFPDDADEGQDQQDAEQDEEGQEPSTAELQAEIARLRKEAASYRIKAREARKAAKTAASPTPEGDVKAAEERGRESARMEYGVKLAAARVEAALAGVVPDDQIDDVVDDLNLSRYVTDDGDVDDEAIRTLRDKYTALLGTRKTAKVSHGKTGSPATGKSTRDQGAEVLANLFTT